MNRNLFFQEKTLYTLKECQEALWNLTPLSSFPCKVGADILFPLTSCSLIDSEGLIYRNTYGLSFLKSYNNTFIPENNAYLLINKLIARYKDHYAIMCNDDSQETLTAKSKEIFTKIFNTLDYTSPKYDELLNLYSNNKSKLLDKLGRTRAGIDEYGEQWVRASKYY